jgi:hypothetical protein
MTTVGVGEAVFLHESVVRGHHVFKDVWNPHNGEILQLRQEFGNLHEACSVALIKDGELVVGHVPRENSRVFWYFIDHGGTISCEVIGKRKHGKGLEVPCVYKFSGKEKLILKLKSILQKNSYQQ